MDTDERRQICGRVTLVVWPCTWTWLKDDRGVDVDMDERRQRCGHGHGRGIGRQRKWDEIGVDVGDSGMKVVVDGAIEPQRCGRC